MRDHPLSSAVLGPNCATRKCFLQSEKCVIVPGTKRAVDTIDPDFLSAGNTLKE